MAKATNHLWFLIACCVLSAAPVQTQTGAVESRIRALEDKEQIAQLLIDYGRHLDSRDLAAYAALFAADGNGAVRSRAFAEY